MNPNDLLNSNIQLVVNGEDLRDTILTLGRQMYERGYCDAVRDNAAALLDKTYSKKEAAEEVGVSLRTLDNWATAGICKPNKVGGRVFYTHEQILTIKGINRYRKC